ncbi:O-methyltransferase [Priestia megaterium]|uniref:tRNA 5-hydroxyuridine methyltransferase n=1 Tax=Priestia aryabhattai TaxID=412384 RepID=A0ABD5L062_PRIAR|nr:MULTISPECIES: O-methyltransferase [Priestia]MBK0292917.1 O-methyltransferase [Bacillus sp. S34]UPK50657.1 O-methyltransferase [Bacillus sp. H8-1]MDC7766418.1 O-methyltransferase [Priestia aryabhattai]MDH3140347.1 O-methyltransferase [Priestia megaterium]MEB4884889.1 O-methyltransferase [Priestia megaterium]
MLLQNVEQYVEKLIPKRQELIEEMEAYAKEHHVPIMELIGVETLLQILRLHQPKHILEIGTAIAYSSIRITHALPEARVVTVERNEERYQKAQEFIERAGKQDKIVSLFGDALELRDEIERHGPYDAVFIDAAKGQYQRFFEHYEPMLSSKGMIISDNVLFKGHVATDLAEVETRRRRSLIKKIQAYNTWLMNHPDYYTTILPIGDGIAISIKRGDQE